MKTIEQVLLAKIAALNAKIENQRKQIVSMRNHNYNLQKKVEFWKYSAKQRNKQCD